MSCNDDILGEGVQNDLVQPVELVPAGFIQFHSLQDIQPLCQAGLSPQIISGVLMRILGHHFSNERLIMEPNLKQYIWSADPAASKIRIVTNTYFDAAQAGLFPALVVKRGPMTSDRRAIGDRVGMVRAEDHDTGTVTYSRFVEGTHRIFTLAESDGAAELLALEVFDTMTFLSPAIVETLPFHDFQVTSLGELSVLDAMGNKIGVAVDLKYAYEYSWAVRPIGPVLKTLDLRL